MVPTEQLVDPTVRTLVTALNAGDKDAFVATLAPDATMADDGVDRDLDDWIDREIFSSNGHLEVESQSDDGRALIARYRNDTWGEMRTSWAFTIVDGRVTRMETRQA